MYEGLRELQISLILSQDNTVKSIYIEKNRVDHLVGCIGTWLQMIADKWQAVSNKHNGCAGI